jgi:hypothetical protein
MTDWTEQDYYEMIEDALNQPVEDRRHPDYPVDHVAGIEDWGRFRMALMRWLARNDAEHFEGHKVSGRWSESRPTGRLSSFSACT